MFDFLPPSGLLDAEPPVRYAVIATGVALPSNYDGVPRPAQAGAPTRIVILDPAGEGIEGGVFVDRYDATVGFITSFWFGSREEAIAELQDEFGGALGVWTPVPKDERNAEHYVLSAVQQDSHR